MSFAGPLCLWCEFADFGFPKASLVYPSVYPRIGRIGESEWWRGLWRIFRFRPSHQYPCAPAPFSGPGAFLQFELNFYNSVTGCCYLPRHFGVGIYASMFRLFLRSNFKRSPVSCST